jgi:adhesin transport system membrane fusion protein
MKIKRQDLEFAGEYNAALHQGAPTSSLKLLAAVSFMLLCFFTWAYFADIDEVARGEGQVIPSGRTQVVESLEGGIVKEILASVGDRVSKDQMLVQIDDTGFSSDLGELRAREISLLAQTIRLEVEISNKNPRTLEFPETLSSRAPDVVSNERRLFDVRMQTLETQIQTLRERLSQRQRELNEARSNATRLTQTLEIASEERRIKEPLAKRGIIPKTEFMTLKREIVDIEGQLAAANETIPRFEAAVREAEQNIEEQTFTFRQEAQAELNTKLTDLSVVQEALRGATDKVVRTDVRAPDDGVINQLHVNTIGEVIQAGETLVEIVPLGDDLLVEARITPSDIAFIHADQKAVVKITAYDFSIYGGLAGKVERISADSAVDEATRERYYTVTVRTQDASLRKGNKVLPIIPGMVASVDIITGKKSVLDYLLKPINKARNEALRER